MSHFLNELSILQRFFGSDYSTMMLVMRQVALPVAIKKGR